MDHNEWISELIRNFLASSENNLGNATNDKAFDNPIIGYASGDDPIFDFFKKDIGPFYFTPMEAFKKKYPDSRVKYSELTVISWVLPHITQTKKDNHKEKVFPSERWARGKKNGQLVIMKLQQHLIRKLNESGIRAMAPVSPPHWSIATSEKYKDASSWSERHTAFAAGLGTFGLCEGLITSIGKAMRCGSIIAELRIPPTPRPYKSHTEYCLYLSEGLCGACISRCPVGAISSKGHDKEKCKSHVDISCTEHSKKNYNIDINVCGLCQTKVPCESMIPKRKLSTPKQHSRITGLLIKQNPEKNVDLR